MSSISSQLMAIERQLKNWMGFDSMESFQAAVRQLPDEHIAVLLHRIEYMVRELRENLDSKVIVQMQNTTLSISMQMLPAPASRDATIEDVKDQDG